MQITKRMSNAIFNKQSAWEYPKEAVNIRTKRKNKTAFSKS